MDIKEVIYNLSYVNGELRRDEIEYAREHKDIIVPELLKMMDYTMDNLDSILDGESCFSGFIYVIFLLAEFRCKELYPYLIKLMHEGDDTLDFILGDDFLENLSSLLASSYNGDDAALLDIIFDNSVDEFIRISGLSAFSILYLEGVKDRKFLLDLITKTIESIDVLGKEDNLIYDLVLDEIVDLKLIELKDLVDVFKDKVSDDDLISDFDKLVNTNDTSLNRDKYPLYRHYDYIKDCIKIMEEWAMFCHEDEFEYSDEYEKYKEIKNSKVSYKNKFSKNQLCHCGSGKKYKKCCLDNDIERDDEQDKINYHLAWAEFHELEESEINATKSYRFALLKTVEYCKKYGITTIDDFDKELPKYELLSNWLEDYFFLLHNFKTRHYNYEIIEACDMLEEAFDLDKDDYWKREITMNRADALVFLGDFNKGEELILNFLKNDPKWTLGYVTMADWYGGFYDSVKKDSNKAIEILEKGLLQDSLEDLECIYERLIDLYKEVNNKDKVKYYEQKLKEYEEREDLPF